MCSGKYQDAKAAGTLNGESWPQFYSRCAAETKANPPAAAATPPAAAATAAPAAEATAPAAPPPAALPPAPVVEAPAPAAVPERPTAQAAPPPQASPPVNPLKKPATKPAAPAPATPAPSTAVFPTAIAPAHAGEKPGKARMKTCLDQYNANKATNANGGLKWIQKGGGYYSECTKRLKG
ncbi:MAG: hypothetical protein ACREC9_03680 [Methylocella sp.]